MTPARAILTALALSACSAQANEPALSLSQRQIVEMHIAKCGNDELACQLDCDNTFSKREHEDHWAVCSDIVATRFKAEQ